MPYWGVLYNDYVERTINVFFFLKDLAIISNFKRSLLHIDIPLHQKISLRLVVQGYM